MSDFENALEAHLLRLGAQELKIEKAIFDLRAKAKEVVQSGRLDRADELCSTMEELRSALVPLQSEIMAVERKLYGLRRQRRS
ncbi:MAG: hypothetical protein ABL907_06710 [Hyphomicrobium sp.]